MPSSNDPLAAVLRYVDAFDNGDAQAVAAICADPMQILDGMAPHVRQGPMPPRTGTTTCSPKASTSRRRVSTSLSMSHAMSMSPTTTRMSWFPPP